MTIQELLHIFALDVQEGMSDDQIGEQAELLAKKIEALVRKDFIDKAWEYVVKSSREECGSKEEFIKFVNE
jgi:hypothetical protein